jgi:hypothetical protein
VAGWLVTASLVAGCGILASPAPTALALPTPTCGGARIEIPGALPCDDLVGIALGALRAEVPALLDRGVIAISVELGGCPRNEIPAQLDCTGEDFVQLVTFTFGPSVQGGPTEPSMAVGLGPVTGRVLGIVNPLLR